MRDVSNPELCCVPDREGEGKEVKLTGDLAKAHVDTVCLATHRGVVEPGTSLWVCLAVDDDGSVDFVNGFSLWREVGRYHLVGSTHAMVRM
jgi:hypothetical protein